MLLAIWAICACWKMQVGAADKVGGQRLSKRTDVQYIPSAKMLATQVKAVGCQNTVSCLLLLYCPAHLGPAYVPEWAISLLSWVRNAQQHPLWLLGMYREASMPPTCFDAAGGTGMVEHSAKSVLALWC